jgi:hypothetical protein
MNKQPHLNLLKIAGGISTLSGISHGLFSLFNKFTEDKTNSPKLTPWLESYIEEVRVKLKGSKEQFLKKETIACVVNLLSELEEYLYLKNCMSLEDKRILLIESPKEYEAAVFECLECHEKYFAIAKNFLKKRLSINFEAILDCVNSNNMKEFKILLEENQKEFDDLPNIDKEIVKKAFIVYCNQQMHHEKVSENLFLISKADPDFYKVAMEIHNLNKFLLKDTMQREYGINEKYFYQLLKKNDLLNDSQIINFREIEKDLKSKTR